MTYSQYVNRQSSRGEYHGGVKSGALGGVCTQVLPTHRSDQSQLDDRAGPSGLSVGSKFLFVISLGMTSSRSHCYSSHAGSLEYGSLLGLGYECGG